METTQHQLQKATTNAVMAVPLQLVPSARDITAQLQNTIQAFWEIKPAIRFFSASDSPHYYWHMQDFYVAQKGLDKSGTRWSQLRLSEGLCQFLFERTLGKRQQDKAFSLADIQNFEVFVLERFSRRLFQLLSPAFLKSPSKHAPPPEQDQLIHLVWVLQGEPEQVNQIILTAPQVCFKTPATASEKSFWILPDSLFSDLPAEVGFRLGSTQIRLEDLQHLEPGDVIMLDNSQANQWHLWNPSLNRYQSVRVTLPQAILASELWMQQGWNAMSQQTQSPNSIWDNLEVEVTATFQPVKLPLKQIKEMEQGLVLEVGDLMDSKVKIEVEGHPIAWGELLVIGDKFGVRVQGLQDTVAAASSTQVITSSTSGDRNTETNHPAVPLHRDEPEEEASSKPAQNEEEDDFMNLDDTDFDDLDDDEDWT